MTVAEGSQAQARVDAAAALQWGRNLTVAEGLQRELEEFALRELQWGRNLTVAEGAPACARALPLRRFNGAAT